MKTSELMELMEKAGQKGGSELNMRSEELQERNRVKRIPSVSKGLKKKARLLLMLEVALPFNPMTGEEDDTFNSSCKYRPPVSATSAALLIKNIANDVEKTKALLMKRAGVTEWDTSDPDTFTETDRKIFSKYRVPRLFSINVVSVNIPAITKDYSRDYAIKVNRDPNTGDIIGEWPVALKINKLFRDKCYEEIADYEKKIESGELKHTDDQQREFRQNVYSRNPVSDDHPANWAEIIEIPLTNKLDISADCDLTTMTDKGIKDLQRTMRYSKKLKTLVEQFTSGDLEKFDKYFDFYEMDMVCPVEGDENSKKGKMEIGQNTTFEKASEKLVDQAGYDNFAGALRDYIDADIDIEREVLRSVYVSEYNEAVERQLIASLDTVFNLTDPFCTEKVLQANRDIISAAFGDAGIMLLEEADAGVSDKDAGDLDEDQAKTEAKQYDLTSAEFSDDSDTSMIDLESVSLED